MGSIRAKASKWLFVGVALISACGAGDDRAAGEDVFETRAAVAAPPTDHMGRARTTWNQVKDHRYTSFEQDVTVVEINTYTFVSIYGTMLYGPNWSLTIRMLPNQAAAFDFSMASASDVQAPPGGTCYSGNTVKYCTTGAGEALVGKTVKLAVIKSNRDNGADLWWSAWAQIKNGRGFYLGQLKAPYQGAIASAHDATEAAGTRDPSGAFCSKPPERTSIVFGPPTVSSPVLSRRNLSYAGSTLSDCYGPSSLAAPFYDGAVHFLGP